MATTIKSTALDFDNIKNNLKSHLESTQEFKDYNFEASGLSSILDVLAYNTHINALTANFALNESFLSTAQLRSSVVSLAEGIGYIPDSKSPSEAEVRLSLNLTDPLRPNLIEIPSGYSFNATGDDSQQFIFQTKEALTGTDDGSGYYQFMTADQVIAIPIYEGTAKRKTFIAGDSQEAITYVIPDENMSTAEAIVRVYDSPSSDSFYTTYTDILKATTINETSTLYIIKELPNGFYELSFGNGTTLGKAPVSGTKIIVDYLSVAGSASDQLTLFEPNNGIAINESISAKLPVVNTVSKSSSGSDRESIESIRKNAPFQYATQNRMVTAEDYSSLVLKTYSSRIENIKSWGGEDDINPEFGTIFMSIDFKDNVSNAVKTATKTNVLELGKQLAVASFNVKFKDPIDTFIETQVFFQFNPRLTTLTQNTIQTNVRNQMVDYFGRSTGSFDKAFRRSNLLSEIDELSPAILSSRAEVKMQQRVTPILTLEDNHDFVFPTSIASPDDVNYIIKSTSFVYNNLNCLIRNKLNSTKLEVVNINNNTVVVTNVGSYVPSTGVVNIVGLTVDTINGNNGELRLSVIPANQSAVAPVRNDILQYDDSTSLARAINVTATN